VATSTADQAIVARRNELHALEAELKATVRSAELTAKAAADEARSIAEKELQDIRKEVEAIRLRADVVLPADADREAKELLAKGEAAPIQAQGEAVAKSLELLAKAWADAGPDAGEIFLINQIESLTETAVEALDRVEIGETHLIDTGDGRAIASLASSFPEAVSGILGSMRASTGVDIPGILSRQFQNSLSQPGGDKDSSSDGATKKA
jgi:flotillin